MPTRLSVRGSGPAIVLIPGLASSADVWQSISNQLASSRSVYLVHIAGFAGEPSRGEKAGGVIAPIVESIASHLTAGKAKSAVLIGHSMGGVIALELARAHPHLVGKVVVVDTLPFVGLMYGPNATIESIAPFAEQVVTRLENANDEQFSAIQKQSVARLAKDPKEQERLLTWSLRTDRKVLAQSMRELFATDLRPRLSGISNPVTVIYAYDDAMMVPPKFVDALYADAYRELPRKKLIRIDGSFHFIMLDQPAGFAASLERVLADR